MPIFPDSLPLATSQATYLDWLPAWLQAIGGLGALGVTVWLATLTRRYVRITEQIANTGREQVDRALALARQSQVTVALTLMEEVRRVRNHLGPTAGAAGGVVSISSPADVPQVHRWLHAVIPQIAASDASIVGEFMGLERDLRGLRAAYQDVVVARQVRDEAVVTRNTLDAHYKNSGNTPDDVSGWRGARQEAAAADKRVERFLMDADGALSQCHLRLDGLQKSLEAVANQTKS